MKDEYQGTASFCKGVATTLFIVEFIGSFVLGSTFSNSRGFNWVICISAIVGGVVVFASLYGLGELIELLGNISSNTYMMAHKSSSETRKKLISERYSASVPTSNNGGVEWKCSKCGTANDSKAQFCKDCGTYK